MKITRTFKEVSCATVSGDTITFPVKDFTQPGILQGYIEYSKAVDDVSKVGVPNFAAPVKTYETLVSMESVDFIKNGNIEKSKEGEISFTA